MFAHHDISAAFHFGNYFNRKSELKKELKEESEKLSKLKKERNEKSEKLNKFKEEVLGKESKGLSKLTITKEVEDKSKELEQIKQDLEQIKQDIELLEEKIEKFSSAYGLQAIAKDLDFQLEDAIHSADINAVIMILMRMQVERVPIKPMDRDCFKKSIIHDIDCLFNYHNFILLSIKYVEETKQEWNLTYDAMMEFLYQALIQDHFHELIEIILSGKFKITNEFLYLVEHERADLVECIRLLQAIQDYDQSGDVEKIKQSLVLLNYSKNPSFFTSLENELSKNLRSQIISQGVVNEIENMFFSVKNNQPMPQLEINQEVEKTKARLPLAVMIKTYLYPGNQLEKVKKGISNLIEKPSLKSPERKSINNKEEIFSEILFSFKESVKKKDSFEIREWLVVLNGLLLKGCGLENIKNLKGNNAVNLSRWLKDEPERVIEVLLGDCEIENLKKENKELYDLCKKICEEKAKLRKNEYTALHAEKLSNWLQEKPERILLIDKMDHCEITDLLKQCRNKHGQTESPGKLWNYEKGIKIYEDILHKIEEYNKLQLLYAIRSNNFKKVRELLILERTRNTSVYCSQIGILPHEFYHILLGFINQKLSEPQIIENDSLHCEQIKELLVEHYTGCLSQFVQQSEMVSSILMAVLSGTITPLDLNNYWESLQKIGPQVFFDLAKDRVYRMLCSIFAHYMAACQYQFDLLYKGDFIKDLQQKHHRAENFLKENGPYFKRDWRKYYAFVLPLMLAYAKEDVNIIKMILDGYQELGISLNPIQNFVEHLPIRESEKIKAIKDMLNNYRPNEIDWENNFENILSSQEEEFKKNFPTINLKKEIFCRKEDTQKSEKTKSITYTCFNSDETFKKEETDEGKSEEEISRSQEREVEKFIPTLGVEQGKKEVIKKNENKKCREYLFFNSDEPFKIAETDEEKPEEIKTDNSKEKQGKQNFPTTFI